MSYIQNFASTMTSCEVANYTYQLESTFNNEDKLLTDKFFFRMGDSDLLMFLYDHMEKSLTVKFTLWLYTVLGHKFCVTCSQIKTVVSLSIIPSVIRLITALALSYIDLFKDIFLAHLIYTVTLENNSNNQDINSVPVVVFWSTIGSILASEIGKLIVILGSPEFYKWYLR